MIALCIGVAFLVYEFWKEGWHHGDWTGMIWVLGVAVIFFIGFLAYGASEAENALEKGVFICLLLALIGVPVFFWIRALKDPGTSKLSDEELEEKGIYPDLEDPRVNDLIPEAFNDPEFLGAIQQNLKKRLRRTTALEMTPFLYCSVLVILGILAGCCDYPLSLVLCGIGLILGIAGIIFVLACFVSETFEKPRGDDKDK